MLTKIEGNSSQGLGCFVKKKSDLVHGDAKIAFIFLPTSLFLATVAYAVILFKAMAERKEIFPHLTMPTWKGVPSSFPFSTFKNKRENVEVCMYKKLLNINMCSSHKIL